MTVTRAGSLRNTSAGARAASLLDMQRDPRLFSFTVVLINDSEATLLAAVAAAESPPP